MANRMPFFRVSGSNAAVTPPITTGDYYAATNSATPPDPTNALAWTSTTKFQDVGLNDHTTVEKHTGDVGTCYLHALHAFASVQSVTSWTYAANTVGPGSGVPKYWDGAAWQTLETVNWNHVSAQWEDKVVGDFTINAQYVCLTAFDNAAASPVAQIGDSRPA